MARPYSHPKVYSPAEIDLLKAIYVQSSQAELLAAFPGRSLASIRCQAGELRLLKIKNPLTKWTPEMDAVLREHYPLIGSEGVAKRLKLPKQAVKRRAGHLQVYVRRMVRNAVSKTPRPTEHSFVPKSTKTLRPLLVGSAPEPVKRSPATPNLNARVEQRRRADKERDQLPKEFVRAEEIRKLSANHPARLAYTVAAHQGPAAATKAYHEAMATYKQAA